MLELIMSSIEAHGGLARWDQVRQISATFTPGGLALQLRGQEAFSKSPTRITVDTREQRVTFDPFLAPGQIGVYEPWTEDGEAWRAMKVTFPKSYVTHSSEQVLYFDDEGLIRRQDYSVDIAAGAAVAHYVHDHHKFGGIIFPTRRRIYPRGPDQQPNKDVVIMSADLSDFKLLGAAP